MTRKPGKSASPDEYKRRVAAFTRLMNDNGGHEDWFDPFEDVLTPPRKRANRERVKPGRKPRGDWPTLIAEWLRTDEIRQGENIDVLVEEAKIFLCQRIGWAPKDNKDLRAKIRELVRGTQR